MYNRERIPLDPTLRCSDAVEFEAELRRRVVGQDEAVIKVTETVQKFMAGLNDSDRTVGNILLLGPTGSGKTRLVEAVCEVLFADPKGMVKIDCAEFKHSHETSKIIGSPPGYLGHDSANKQITQDKLDKTHNENIKLSVLLFDEIEKAHPDFWDLLLGMLDKGQLTDNKGNIINLRNTLIFMTSNIGAREVQDVLNGSIGFISVTEVDEEKIKKISGEAATRKFNPEFMNRLDQVIVFQHLGDTELRLILEIETGHIQKRILSSKQLSKFVFTCSDDVKTFLIKEGTSRNYGARHLKRTLEKYLVTPMVNFVLTLQVNLGDLVEVLMKDGKMGFDKVPADVIAESGNDEWRDFKKAIDE